MSHLRWRLPPLCTPDWTLPAKAISACSGRRGLEQTETLFERWNTYSRVRVTPLGNATPFGWGLAHTPETKVEQKYLDIDADASTVITQYDGDIGKLSYLKDDVINAAYLVQAADRRRRRWRGGRP